jgi:hypothetical protein
MFPLLLLLLPGLILGFPKVHRLFDAGKKHVLVESMEGRLEVVNIVTGDVTSVPRNRGTLLGAKFASGKHIIQYIQDDEYHTLYDGDNVIMGTLNPVLSLIPYRTNLLTLTHGGEATRYNIKTGESRSLLCERNYRDLPTCARIYKNYLIIGTLLGSLIIIRESDMAPVIYERHHLCVSVGGMSIDSHGNNVRVTTLHNDCSDKVFEMNLDDNGLMLTGKPSLHKSPYVNTCMEYAMASNTHVIKGLTCGTTIVYDKHMNTVLHLPYGTCMSPILKDNRLIYHCKESGEVVIMSLND